MDNQWLKTQFTVNPDKTKAGLAEAVGLEPSAISKILKGTRQIKAQEYVRMRGYFGLPSDGHNAAKSDRSSYSFKPMAGAPAFADGGTPPDNWVIPASIYSPRTNAAAENLKVFEVKETFMEPNFQRGDYVLVDVSEKNPDPPGVFVVSDGFSHMLRNCELTVKSKIKISATRNFETQILMPNEFLILGRVIAKLNLV